MFISAAAPVEGGRVGNQWAAGAAARLRPRLRKKGPRLPRGAGAGRARPPLGSLPHSVARHARWSDPGGAHSLRIGGANVYVWAQRGHRQTRAPASLLRGRSLPGDSQRGAGRSEARETTEGRSPTRTKSPTIHRVIATTTPRSTRAKSARTPRLTATTTTRSIVASSSRIRRSTAISTARSTHATSPKARKTKTATTESTPAKSRSATSISTARSPLRISRSCSRCGDS